MDFVQPFQPVKCILDRWENYCMAHSSLDANNLVSKGWMFVGILPNKVGQNLDADCCGQNWKSYILFSWVMVFFFTWSWSFNPLSWATCCSVIPWELQLLVRLLSSLFFWDFWPLGFILYLLIPACCHISWAFGQFTNKCHAFSNLDIQ